MSIVCENTSVNFSGVVYEDEVIVLRDFLQEKAGEKLSLNFVECDDVHLAVLQLAMAYQKNYSLEYTFGESVKLYQKVLEGFDTSENHCN